MEFDAPVPDLGDSESEEEPEHGLIKGSIMGIKRIFSCHPFKILGGGHGLDVVPNKKDLTKEKLNG